VYSLNNIKFEQPKTHSLLFKTIQKTQYLKMDVFDSQLKKHPMAYINFLQQQNRAKKQVELQDKEKLINKQKEEAFNLYLQGANEARVENQRKREKIGQLREKSVGINARKKWGASGSNRSSRPIIPTLTQTSINEDQIRPFTNMSESRSSRRDQEKLSRIKEIIENFTEKQLNCVLNFLDNLL
jgi:hypothetical protein